MESWLLLDRDYRDHRHLQIRNILETRELLRLADLAGMIELQFLTLQLFRRLESRGKSVRRVLAGESVRGVAVFS